MNRFLKLTLRPDGRRIALAADHIVSITPKSGEDLHKGTEIVMSTGFGVIHVEELYDNVLRVAAGVKR